MSSFDKPKTPHPIQGQSLLPSTNINTYDFTKILNRKKKSKHFATILELQSKIKTLKNKLQNFKQPNKKTLLFSNTFLQS
jgi:division protein CdvB (Snf7/Vps24/ESCRT-III family)